MCSKAVCKPSHIGIFTCTCRSSTAECIEANACTACIPPPPRLIILLIVKLRLISVQIAPACNYTKSVYRRKTSESCYIHIRAPCAALRRRSPLRHTERMYFTIITHTHDVYIYSTKAATRNIRAPVIFKRVYRAVPAQLPSASNLATKYSNQYIKSACRESESEREANRRASLQVEKAKSVNFVWYIGVEGEQRREIQLERVER